MFSRPSLVPPKGTGEAPFGLPFRGLLHGLNYLKKETPAQQTPRGSVCRGCFQIEGGIPWIGEAITRAPLLLV